jgi:hypothetical protein
VLDALEVLERWTLDRGLELVQVAAGEQPLVAPPGEVSACELVVALGGDGTILKALPLSARTQTPVLGVACGGRIASAMNDLVLDRGKGTQLVLDVCVDGDLYVRLAGDGIVVATPLGSSAYSMAADGSLLGAGTLEVHPGHSGSYLSSDGFSRRDRGAPVCDHQRAYRTGPEWMWNSRHHSRPRRAGAHAGKSLERPVRCPTARWPAVDLPAGHLG